MTHAEILRLLIRYQWRIQDFPRGGAPTLKIAIIFHIFAENCMKMKEFGPPGGARVPGAPLGSANGYGHFRVPSQKLIWGSTSLIGSHDHVRHNPPGGEFPIPTHHEKRPVQSKIGSLQNIHHLPTCGYRQKGIFVRYRCGDL